MLMIGQATYPMLFPHFSKKRRAIAFAVENKSKSTKGWVFGQLLLAGLIGNIIKQAGNDAVPQSAQQSRIDLFFDHKKGTARGVIDPVVGDTPEVQPLTGYITTRQFSVLLSKIIPEVWI